MADQIEAQPKVSQVAPPEHEHTWRDTVADIYHSAMQTVGLEAAPKLTELKTLELHEFKQIDLSKFKKELELNPPGEMIYINRDYGEEMHRMDPCMRKYFSKAQEDITKIDTSCFDGHKTHANAEVKEEEKKP